MARRALVVCLTLGVTSLSLACSGGDGASIGGDGNGNGNESADAGGPGTHATTPDGAPAPSSDAAGTTPAPDAAAPGAPDAARPDAAGASTDGGGGQDDAATDLDPNVAPGGNFDLSVWELQEPVGSPGAPTTISSSRLAGPHGYQDTYFFTDPTDGSMAFWDPENGVTTANSSYPRSELREMTASGAAANWAAAGTHTLAATLKAGPIPNHVAVGQIHLGTGTPSSTKPLLELFYYATGAIVLGVEQTPAGGNEVLYPAGNVPMGTKWSYVIGLTGNTISLSIDGGTAKTYAMSSTFDQEGMYFKAGDYDQSVGTTAGVGAKVQFYALSVHHAP